MAKPRVTRTLREQPVALSAKHRDYKRVRLPNGSYGWVMRAATARKYGLDPWK